jgi:hypothetical protein
MLHNNTKYGEKRLKIVKNLKNEQINSINFFMGGLSINSVHEKIMKITPAVVM